MRATSIGITGTPGTGKKSIGKELSLILGYELVHMNDLIIDKGFILKRDESGIIVDLKSLRRELIGERYQETVIIGHLLPQVFQRGDLSRTIVLRCDPEELLKRYIPRGYDPKKVEDNLWSEIIDSSLSESIERFGVRSTAEFNTTEKRPKQVAQEISDLIHGNSRKQLGIVNWLTDDRLKRLGLI
ncbi:MAG: adenylate kinase family protein [Nitrososphaerales archaeon]